MAVSGRVSRPGKEYTFKKKLKAFGRGLPRLKPFLKIAEEGLRKNYSLTQRQEDTYIDRINFSKKGKRILPTLFGNKMPELRQNKLANHIAFHIEHTPFQIRCARDDGDKGKVRQLENTVFALRTAVVNAIIEGRVTSRRAQQILATCFVRQAQDIHGDNLEYARARVTAPDSRATDEFKELVGHWNNEDDPLPAA